MWLTLLVLDTFSHQLDDVLKCSEVDPLKDLVDDGASGLGASTHVRAVTGVFGRVASGGFPHQVAFVGLGWRNGLIGIANAGTVRKTCVVPTQSARRHDRTTRRGCDALDAIAQPFTLVIDPFVRVPSPLPLIEGVEHRLCRDRNLSRRNVLPGKRRGEGRRRGVRTVKTRSDPRSSRRC